MQKKTLLRSALLHPHLQPTSSLPATALPANTRHGDRVRTRVLIVLCPCSSSSSSPLPLPKRRRRHPSHPLPTLAAFLYKLPFFGRGCLRLTRTRRLFGTSLVTTYYNKLGTLAQMANDGCGKSRGALIVLEGLDRSGKTSQASRILSFLQSEGFSAELWRFPDRKTCVGEMISSYLANKSELDDHTVHLLFSANRWEKRSLMESRLRDGTTLIVDRYSYSGVAFSAAKGLDVEWCKAPEKGLLAPDLVLYLDIQPEKAAQRGNYGEERYEQIEFQRKVAKYYQTLFDDKWKVIDACLPLEDVEKQLRDLSFKCVTACRKGERLCNLWL